MYEQFQRYLEPHFNNILITFFSVLYFKKGVCCLFCQKNTFVFVLYLISSGYVTEVGKNIHLKMKNKMNYITAITYWHKHFLKQVPTFSSQVGHRSRKACLVSSAQDLKRLEARCWQGCVLIWSWKPSSNVIQITEWEFMKIGCYLACSHTF